MSSLPVAFFSYCAVVGALALGHPVLGADVVVVVVGVAHVLHTKDGQNIGNERTKSFIMGINNYGLTHSSDFMYLFMY